MADNSSGLPPLLEATIKQICVELVRSSKQVTFDRISNELKTRKFPVTAQTGRLVSYWISNPNNVAAIVKSEAEAKAAEAISTPNGKSKGKHSTEKDKVSSAKRQKTVDGGSASEGKQIDQDIERAVRNRISANMSATASPYLQTTRPALRLADLAGMEVCVSKIRELVFNPIYMSTIYKRIGVVPTCTLLLHGPSGCGKTALANAIAGELNLPFYKVSAPELVGSMSGESEQRIKDMFSHCQQKEEPAPIPLNPNLRAPPADTNNTASKKTLPSVLFIDNIDVIAGKKADSNRGMDKRIIATLSECIDSLVADNDTDHATDGAPAPALASTATAVSAAATAVSTDTDSDVDTDAAAEGMLVECDGAVPGLTNTASASGAWDPPRLVILIAATNKADALEANIRGRFANEIVLPPPDAEARAKILEHQCVHVKQMDLCFATLGNKAIGYVGSDLKILVEKAGLHAVRRIIAAVGGESACLSHIFRRHIESVFSIDGSIFTAPPSVKTPEDESMGLSAGQPSTSAAAEELSAAGIDVAQLDTMLQEHCHLQMSDFLDAMKTIVPTAKREGFAVVPEIAFADIGALGEIRAQLFENIVFPIQQPELYNHFGLGDATAGILLYGPPGCGKTLLAKAVANECAANFISVKGPELLKSLVGESERGVRDVFDRARASVPCVIFFDEIDSLVPKRGGGSGDNNVSDRVVAQFLTELDGVETRKGVYVIGATNRLELIDDAILRAKRFGTMLYVPLPSATERAEILMALSRTKATAKTAYSEEIDFNTLAEDPRCEGFSGADLANLLRESALMAIRDYRSQFPGGITVSMISSAAPPMITPRHFELAFSQCKPSVPAEERERYHMVKELLEKHNKHPLEALRIANDATTRKKHAATRSLLSSSSSSSKNTSSSSVPVDDK